MTALLTAEEFAALPDRDLREELVRGEVVARPLIGGRGGVTAANLFYLMHKADFANRGWGTLVGYSGVVVARDPDTVRGPDACAYSYERIPPGIRIPGYPTVLPEVAFEIRAFYETWDDVMEPVGDYLAVGVVAVVIDPDAQTVHVFAPNQPPRVLGPGDVFDLPALWPGLAFPVADLFV